jgi:hypothetical protein
MEKITESKISAFFERYHMGNRWEASGVCEKDGNFFVVFDNLPHIARFGPDLSPEHPHNTIILHKGAYEGFEDITFLEKSRRFCVLVEAVPFQKQSYKARIREYDENLNFIEENWVDFKLSAANKGLEGLAYVEREGSEYILGLCEGNKCRGGAAGETPGKGRIQVFRKGSKDWEHVAEVKIPATAKFIDYAGIDVAGERIIVVSQTSAAIWVGELNPLVWEIVGDGKIYHFPQDHGEIVYCTVEGVAWIDEQQIAVVSDRAGKDELPHRCRNKDEAIHLFRLLDA